MHEGVSHKGAALIAVIVPISYEEIERACSLVTAVRFLNAKNGVDYKFSLHFLPGLWYTAYGISAIQFQPFACN